MLLGASLIALGTVMFLGEVFISAARGRPLHNWNDTLVGLGMQAGTGFMSHLGKLYLLALYVPLHSTVAVFEWTGTPLAWLCAFLTYDFMGYWFHRFSHRTNLGWAVHVVHHQSEELNLATAVRTAPLRSMLDWPTLLPMAVLGIPPTVLMALYILHAAGQYWLHVEWIPKMGPLGWVLNTPSHHRVHHGCQEGYQDANYGAHLIVFDRLFGTFVPETEPAHYGVIRPVDGWDPLRSITEPFAMVWRDSREWSPMDRIQVWIRPPGWTPVHGNAPRGTPPARRTILRPAHLQAAVAHTLITSVLLLSVQAPLLDEAWQKLGMGLLGIWSLRVQGLLLDDRAPSLSSELVRAALITGLALVLPMPLMPAVAAMGVLTAVLALSHQNGEPATTEPASTSPSA